MGERKRKHAVLAGVMASVIFLTAIPMPVLAEGQEPETNPAGEEVFLSDLDWEWAYAGLRTDTTPMYGDQDQVPANAKKPKKDYRFDGNNVGMYISYDVNARIYDYNTLISLENTAKVDKGIGTSAASEIVYALNGAYEKFTVTPGFEVYALTNKNRPSSVEFKLLGSKTTDDSTQYEELWDSGIVYSSDKGEDRPYFVPREVQVSVRDYQYLKLWVSDAGETGMGGTNPTNQSDAVNWAFARLTKSAGTEDPAYNGVYLSDLTKSAFTGNEAAQDTSFSGQAITVGGKAYCKGLGMKADASVTYDLGDAYEYFRADIGFDDASALEEAVYTVYGYNESGGKDTITEGILNEDNRNQSIGGPVMGIVSLELCITSNSQEEVLVNWGDARLDSPQPETAVEVYDITLDGKALEGFTPSNAQYEITLSGNSDIPVVDAKAAEGLTVEILQAESIPGNAVIKVTDGTREKVYTIAFSRQTEELLSKIEVSTDRKELNPLINKDEKAKLSLRAYDKEGELTELPEGTKVTYTAKSLYKSGDVTVADVSEDGTVTPLNGGVAEITAQVEAGGQVRKDKVNITVRPFYQDYHQSMVMKMFLGQNGSIKVNLDEALGIIKNMDNMTRDIPKIIYLVGWQYDGHDSGYPSFAKVNEKLKRAEDASAKDSLIWLMEEAKKYNTTVSLHINMLDASDQSPLWDEYLEKDVIAKNADGTLKTYVWGYPISYTAEWNAGLTQRRIDELFDLLPPLKEAGTIHIDAFHTVIPGYTNEAISPYHETKYGYTSAAEEETQRKIFAYWREKGVDVTSEFVSSYRKDKFIGLQPMAWHFSSLSNLDYLQIPASLYCGGDRGLAVFGENMAAEGIIKADKTTLKGFMEDFALKTVPFYFLNRLERLNYDSASKTATLSDEVTSWQEADNSLHMTQKDAVLRDDTDIFMPAQWNEDRYPELFAYSKTGYADRTWKLPPGYEDISAVDIYRINLSDVQQRNKNVPVSEGHLTLSLSADEAVSIVPAGTDLDTTNEDKFDYLSDVTPASVQVGYGNLGIDKTVNNSGTLKMDGVEYKKGLGAHAPAELVYNLDGKYDFFHAVVGIDDLRVTNTNLGRVQFQVFLDDNTIPAFESAVMGTNAKPEVIDLALGDTVQKLKITVLTPDGKNTNDWTDIADARLTLNEKGLNYAECNITGFSLAEQVNKTQLDSEKQTISIKVPYGTDLSALTVKEAEFTPRTQGSVQSGDIIDARQPVIITVSNLAGETKEWTLFVTEKEQKAILKSDNKFLEDNFYWASHKVDQFVMTGQSGLINKASDKPGSGPVDYDPSYWAGYYDRTAYYGRDFCHQATGGQLAGLRNENFNMFKTFAQGATEARKYYTLWAFNFDGSPYTIDYRSDTNFVREVPAQFELVEKAYEQYLWTGDERYIQDEDMFRFYTNVMTKYIALHDDQNPNGVAEGYGSIWSGSCTYNERGEHPVEAGDAIGAQYQATLAYAGILDARGQVTEAAAWFEKAQMLKDYFNKEWSANPDNPDGNYARVITQDGTKLYDFGKENSWFMPMKLITEPGKRNDAYLDYISQKLGKGIGDKNAPDAPKNIEAYTYIPDTYFPYNRNEEAWKWMKYIAGIKDNPHERPIQGTNGDYPEISFTFVSQTIEGIMGIEPDAGKDQVVTASHLADDMNYVDVTDIRMGDHMLDVRHDGHTKTTLTNHADGSLSWEARFYGSYPYINYKGTKMEAQQKTVNGVTVSYAVIDVSPDETIIAEAEQTTADKKVLKEAIQAAENAAMEYQQGNTTVSSWETYFAALKNARTINASPAALQADVDEAAAELLNAVEGLTIRAELSRVSKFKVLAELCSKMEERYPKEIYAPVKLLLEDLQELLEKESADVGKTELEEAYAALDDAQQTLLEYQPINTEVLMEAIKAAKSLDKSRYTKESYDKVAKAIKDAEQVDLTDQRAINEVVKNLLAEICGLKEVQETVKPVYADVSELHSAIILAAGLNRSKYTEASLRDLDNALTVARALADAKPVNELQATVDHAAKAVKESIQRLVVKPAVPAKNSSHKVGSLIYKVTKSSAGKRTVMLVKPSRKTLSSVKIPDTVKLNGYTFQVTSIGKNAFKGNNRLKTASVGKYVESLGDAAFYKCTKLTKITIGSGLKTIGKKTFYGNKLLKTIKIKSSKLNKAGSHCLKGISTKAVIDVPNKKVKDYKKVFKGKGQTDNVKIK